MGNGDRIRLGARRALVAMLAAAVSVPPAATPSSPAAPDPEPVSAADVPPPAPRLNPRRKTGRRARMSPLPVNQTRWLQADIELAETRAGNGDLTAVAQLYRAFGRDGTIQGLLGTRTGGLVRLPKRFSGTPDAVAKLEGTQGSPGLFDRIFPPSELEQLDADGDVLGVGVGMFMQGEADEYPTLVRLDPEFLLYRWSEDRWYYRSLDGLLPISPGDGTWVLHTPRGRFEPWNRGLWKALGRAYISKEHAILHRENYAGKLANPARVAVSPQGAGEAQKQSWFRTVMAWGVNTVFGVTPGYDVKLVESNGRGFEVFAAIIETSDREAMIAIAGQVVTVTGGTGFANANIHATIRSDLIQGDGNALSATLNAQALPPVVHAYVNANDSAQIAWDTRPPADLKAGAESFSAVAKAIIDLDAALKAQRIELDVREVLSRFAVPVKGDMNGDAVPDGLGVPTPSASTPDSSSAAAPPPAQEAA